MGISPLGDYGAPLSLLQGLTAIKPIARAYQKLRWWRPVLTNGRLLQVPISCACIPSDKLQHIAMHFCEIHAPPLMTLRTSVTFHISRISWYSCSYLMYVHVAEDGTTLHCMHVIWHASHCFNFPGGVGSGCDFEGFLVGVQTDSLLGPPFSLGVVPDVLSQPQPSVHQQCYAGLSKQNPMEVNKTHHMLRAIMKTIHDTLFAISMNFLKGQVGFLHLSLISKHCIAQSLAL